MPFKNIMLKVMVAMLLLGLASGSLVVAQTSPEPIGLRPDAPPYAVHGPYWVGTMDMVIEPNSERPLSVTVWYPALNPDGLEEAVTYISTWKVEAIPAPADLSVLGHALRDALVDLTAAPYPLVVFSHGFATAAPYYAYLMEHFASYGFVVIAPDHQEALDAEFGYSQMWESSIKRPQDVRQTLDYAASLTVQDGAMAGMIDMEQVAVVGQSYGGYTALAMGGARYDLQSFNQRCETAQATGDPNAWLCDPLVPYEAEMAALAGLEGLPEGLWESMGDPRVDAIIPMAGDSYLFDKAGLAAVTIPVMAIGGTLDNSTPYTWGARPTYDYISSPQKILVSLENADHYAFLVKCQDIPFLVEVGFSFACQDPVWDMDRFHDLVDHFSTAFLLATLKGDADAKAALAPEAGQFPGVIYEETGF